MREMRLHFTDRRVLGALAVVSVLTGLVGPFGTFALLDTLPRLAYWSAIIVTTYAVGSMIGILLLPRLSRAIPNRALRIVVIGLVQGPPIALAVYAINALSFDASVFELPWLVLYCTLIALGVVLLSEIAAAYAPRPMAAESVAPPILDRLPVQQRGALQALVVTDHYVEVLTDRGSSLLLLRLSDAMRETGDVVGVQIHRSHWVALAAVERTLRADGKLLVELKGGRRLPISRGYLAAAKAAGLKT
jgi:DNA-binding LytR/AlgR family response regulator